MTDEDEPMANLAVQSALSQCALLEEGDSIIRAVLLDEDEDEEEEEEEAEGEGTQEDLFDLPQLDGTIDTSPQREFRGRPSGGRCGLRNSSLRDRRRAVRSVLTLPRARMRPPCIQRSSCSFVSDRLMLPIFARSTSPVRFPLQLSIYRGAINSERLKPCFGRKRHQISEQLTAGHQLDF